MKTTFTEATFDSNVNVAQKSKSYISNQTKELNGSHTKLEKFVQPKVKGKFIFIGEEKFYVKGVSYGAFKPDENRVEYTDLRKIDEDFSLMAKSGINTVRIPHTMPPRHLLDIADKHNLKVMVGLSAEQYVGFLIDRKKSPNFKKLIVEKLKECKNHPALLCISIGNEIPSSMVRWIGHKEIERYLKKIYNIIKRECPDSIVTYVNYPTTEYLKLPFLDLLCFNVYLENQEDFENYLYRLQNIAGSRPLLMGEIGLDSMRNGEIKQAEILQWQIRSAFKCGCAGLVIFSWTDEWYRGEEEVDDWAFGLTTQDRQPKPALQEVSKSFSNGPNFVLNQFPKMSVLVCSYNGAKTLDQCFTNLQKLNYPDYEVIYVNDGSSDNSLEIASKYDIKIISTENMGLSHARNVGLNESSGDIVAYIDDDAFADPDWLYYLAIDFTSTNYDAIGGPNIIPDEANFTSLCVNNSPGSPTHILHSDRIAEHIPGCNMAFRKDKLMEIGGFDEQFWIAGDDVDACWRIQDNGGVIGFSPSAVVWHKRRDTIRGYWKQQFGYGRSEALLEKKWPSKYNNHGHRSWGGRIYGDGTDYLSRLYKSRIYGGIWGSAPFQSIYDLGKRDVLFFSLMPEWYLICSVLVILSAFGIVWEPLLFAIPLLAVLSIIPLSVVVPSIINLNPEQLKHRGKFYKFKFQFMTTILFIIQPLARLLGRLKSQLTPWRRYSRACFSFKMIGKSSIWTENWIAQEQRLEQLEFQLTEMNPYVYRGGDFDRWDLWIKGGGFGGVRILLASEDHAKGHQYIRFRFTPVISSFSKYLILFTGLLAFLAFIDQSYIAMYAFISFIGAIAFRVFLDIGTAAGCCLQAIKYQKK